MPPLPMSSRISSWGKSFLSSSTGGGTKLDALPGLPGSVPVLKPDLIRHSGHNPSGTLGGKVFWQLGQIRFVSINSVSTLYLGNQVGRLRKFAKTLKA